MKKISFVIVIVLLTLAVFIESLFVTSFIAFSESETSSCVDPKITVEYSRLLLQDNSLRFSIRYTINSDAVCASIEDENKQEALDVIESQIKNVGSLYSNVGLDPKISGLSIDVFLQQFSNYTDYYIASGIDGYETSTDTRKKETGFFYNRYTEKVETVFALTLAPELSSDSLPYLIKTSLESLSEIPNVNIESEVLYVYLYGTKYSKFTVDSTAQKIYYDENSGINMHQFEFTPSQLKDASLTFMTRSPNYFGWYGSLLAIALIVSIVIIIKVRKTKLKNRDIDN
ncbi:MAG: hypothetical protein LBU04_05120 [Christensenellaceae bacterium]|jgi:hypothetical protein|nr:hypothetical protein [Christensenellaceae bacterium]